MTREELKNKVMSLCSIMPMKKLMELHMHRR